MRLIQTDNRRCLITGASLAVADYGHRTGGVKAVVL